MQKKLTQEVVDLAKAEPGAQRSYFWDTAKPGFGLMVTASGHKSYVVQYRYRGHTKRITMAERNLSLDKARREAAVHLGEAAARRNPAANLGKQAKSGTLESIAREYFNREAKKPKAKKLRSLDDRIATFERLIFPGLGSHQITEIKKSDIIHLLERVEDERGPSMARVVFAYLSKLFNWHARRRDADFVSPIVRGMDEDLKDRINPPRDRVLDDNELRALWRAAEGFPGPFGYYVRLLLLTAARRKEAARMSRSELSTIDGTPTWIIPAARMKGNAEHVVPLSRAAKAIIDVIPENGPFVFTTDGRAPLAAFSFFKSRLDDASGVTNWTLHDLRRTARSLLSRAGISADVAERCLAHKIGGVRGVYDRHSFYAEKARAFERLAALIERIVNPPAANVLPLRA